MLSAFISTLRTADLRRKILFTLGIVILYRAGAALPSPGVNYQNIQQCVEQVSGGAGGQTADISIAAREILRWKRTLNETLARHTGKTAEQIEKDSDRDYYMTAEEAKAYGLVDHVVSSTKDAHQLATGA